jgi:uncharacterized protein (UPF0261 family)
MPKPEHAFEQQTKKFEGIGVGRPEAETLTRAITEHIILDRNRLSEKFVAQSDLEKVREIAAVVVIAAAGGVPGLWACCYAQLAAHARAAAHARTRRSRTHAPPRPINKQTMLQQTSHIDSFKAELLQKQDMHLATLHKDLERQQNYLDKMQAQIRCGVVRECGL